MKIPLSECGYGVYLKTVKPNDFKGSCMYGGNSLQEGDIVVEVNTDSTDPNFAKFDVANIEDFTEFLRPLTIGEYRSAILDSDIPGVNYASGETISKTDPTMDYNCPICGDDIKLHVENEGGIIYFTSIAAGIHESCADGFCEILEMVWDEYEDKILTSQVEKLS